MVRSATHLVGMLQDTSCSLSDGFEARFSGVRAAMTALLGRSFAICVIIVPFDGQRKVVPHYVSRLEQTLNKPMVVLVVGVVAVALNVLLYFGIFVPSMTPLIANIHSLGTSLPEAILPEANGRSGSEASSESGSEASSKSDSEASGESGPEASSNADSEASSESVPGASGKSASGASSNADPEGSLESETGSPAASPSGSPPVSPPQQQSSPTPQQQQYL
jgi:hypothetical protein